MIIIIINLIYNNYNLKLNILNHTCIISNRSNQRDTCRF